MSDFKLELVFRCFVCFDSAFSNAGSSVLVVYVRILVNLFVSQFVNFNFYLTFWKSDLIGGSSVVALFKNRFSIALHCSALSFSEELEGY